MNCGVCTATCPLGIDLLPRRLFRYVLLGLEDRVRAEERSRLLVPALPGVRGELPGAACTSPRTCGCCAAGCSRREADAAARRDVVGILADNLRLRGSVLPIPAAERDPVGARTSTCPAAARPSSTPG